MSYSLTSEERQIAINQITLLDRFCFEGPGSCHVVPIPPKRHGEPERWVAVDTSTGSYQFQTNILQPDPERAVLCTHCRYCYGDKFSCYIISSIVSTVIFSAITTPLLLLCCIPMMINLVKARRNIEGGDNESARRECNKWTWWFFGAFIWIAVGVPAVAVTLPIVIVFA